ncbi:hemolysin family protein, partial [Nocardia sp. NPDC003354]
DLVVIERYKTIRQALTLALRSGFSRIPVTGDSEDDVVGIVYLKDLVRRTHISRDAESDLVSTAMRPASFVPDTKNAGDLLREMQKERNHVAVVIDEYGGTAGVATVEDIVEEVVGEVRDEHDPHETPDLDPAGTDEAGHALYWADGSARVDRLERLGLRVPEGPYETVAGLVAAGLGHIPVVGDSLDVAGWRLDVVDATGRRAARVLMHAPLDDAADADGTIDGADGADGTGRPDAGSGDGSGDGEDEGEAGR